jgi:hypothetical protein
LASGAKTEVDAMAERHCGLGLRAMSSWSGAANWRVAICRTISGITIAPPPHDLADHRVFGGDAHRPSSAR